MPELVSCWLCDAMVEAVDGRCPYCDSKIRGDDDYEGGGFLGGYDVRLDFTMLDKDDPDGYGKIRQ